MTELHYASILCKSCGLCCTGHLFIWVRLDARELQPCQSIGLHVIRDDPRQRGFTQPCPAWQGICTVYTSPHYPRGCHSYQCKLFKELCEGAVPLADALDVIRRALEATREVEALLPDSPVKNFRERLVSCLEQPDCEQLLKQRSVALLTLYQKHFGVTDF